MKNSPDGRNWGALRLIVGRFKRECYVLRDEGRLNPGFDVSEAEFFNRLGRFWHYVPEYHIWGVLAWGLSAPALGSKDPIRNGAVAAAK